MEMNQSSEPLVDVVEAGPIAVVSIRTPLLTDTRSITAVVHEVRALSGRCQSPNILIDFHRVEHLSIAFVGEMKVVAEEVELRGGTICCCSLRHEMRAVLEALGLGVFYAGHSLQHAVMRHTTWLEKQNAPTARPNAVL